MKKTWIYYLTVFICGAAVMTAEMSASRLIAPYFGNSLYTWTNIVGLVMTALAIGAFFGGKLADKKAGKNLYFSIVFLTGVWIILIPFVSEIIFKLIIKMVPGSFSTNGSFLAILILMVVPMSLLGMIVPFTMKLIAKDIKNIGTVLGRVSAISTLGSIIGTFLPAFLLIPYLGTTKTFLLVGIILVMNSAIGLSGWLVRALAILSFALFAFVPSVFSAEGIVYAKDSPYHYIFIKDAGNGVNYLMLDNPFGTHSKYNPEKLVLHDYISYMGVLPSYTKEPKKVLILGNASGSLSRIINTFYPDIEVTGIEIDPAITEISKKYMGLANDETKIIHSDARAFLLSNEDKYDLVLIDTYNALDIPVHLTSVEFFELVKNHLTDEGLIGMNVLTLDKELLLTMANTLSTVVTNVSYLTLFSGGNSILLGSNSESFDPSNVPEELDYEGKIYNITRKIFTYDPQITIFTDDKSQAEILSAKNSVAFFATHFD